LKSKFREYETHGEIHKIISDILKKTDPTIVVIIDNLEDLEAKTKEMQQLRKYTPVFLEFYTYVNADKSPIEFLHVFDVLVQIDESEEKASEEIKINWKKSKYDAFWKNAENQAALRALIAEAVKTGKSSELNVTGLTRYGSRERRGWEGNLIIKCGKEKEILTVHRSHLRSLSKILLQSDLVDPYEGIKLEIRTKTYGDENNFEIKLLIEKVP